MILTDEHKCSAVPGSPESCRNIQRAPQTSCWPTINGRKKLGKGVANVTQYFEKKTVLFLVSNNSYSKSQSIMFPTPTKAKSLWVCGQKV